MVQAIDRERIIGKIKREKSLVDFLTGAGGGLVVSCLFSSDSPLRTIVICAGVLMLGVGFCKKESYDKQVLAYLAAQRGGDMTKKFSRRIACVLLLAAIGFLLFALFHPEMSFPWSNTITYTLYAGYLLVMVVFFIAPFQSK